MSSRISPEFLQDLKGRLNLVELVSEHVVLRKTGANFVGLCPFHSERSPSFSVSETKQLYHCYGCQRGGDLVGFVREIFGLGFLEAIEELAERAKVALPDSVVRAVGAAQDPETQARSQAQRKRVELAHKLNRFAAAFYHQQLAQPGRADVQAYLRSRGCSDPELVRAFYLGVTPPGWDGLAGFLTTKQAPLELAQELGLIRPSRKQPGSSFDLFRERLMFPILDLRGRVAGFGGRILPEAAAQAAANRGADEPPPPKYLNSPESLVYQKSKLAFGLFQAQKHIREQDEAVLVEGYFDVVTLHGAGFKNVVAVSGTALSREHLQSLTRLASRITLLFDGDRAGRAAMARCLELGLDTQVVLYAASLPEGLDPDELVLRGESGRKELGELLARAQPVLDQQIELECRGVDESPGDPERLAQALRTVGGWLARVSDVAGREVRIDALARRLSLSRESLLRAMPGVAGARPGGRSPAVGSASASGPGSSREQRVAPRPGGLGSAALASGERRLLLGWLAHPRLRERFAREMGKKLPPRLTISDLFDHPAVRAIVALAETRGYEALARDPQTALAQLEPDTPGVAPAPGAGAQEAWNELRGLVTGLALDPERAARDGLGEADAWLALEHRLKECWARFSQTLKRALHDAEAKRDAGLQAQLLQEYLDVQRLIKEFKFSL